MIVVGVVAAAARCQRYVSTRVAPPLHDAPPRDTTRRSGLIVGLLPWREINTFLYFLGNRNYAFIYPGIFKR